MDPMTLSLALSAIPQVMKIGKGIKQNRQARDLRDNYKRPDYVIPSSATDSLGMARRNANLQQMPGMTAMQGRMDQNTANAAADIMGGTSSSAAALAALGNVYGAQQNQEADLGIDNAQFQIEQDNNLMQALDLYAGYQDKAFEMNKMNPYTEAMQSAGALSYAGDANVFGGVEGLAMTGATALGGGLFGGGNAKSASGGGLAAPESMKNAPLGEIPNPALENKDLALSAQVANYPETGIMPGTSGSSHPYPEGPQVDVPDSIKALMHRTKLYNESNPITNESWDMLKYFQ